VAEPSRRIIVDGVDFANVFQFHRVLRAIAMAMQPARLIIALLMVAALITAGRVWDASTTPKINPEGFLLKQPTPEQRERAQLVFGLALSDLGVETPTNVDEELDGLDVLDDIRDAYIEDAQEINESDLSEDAKQAALAALAADYRATVAEIEKVRLRGTFEATAEYVSNSFQRMINGVIYLRSRDVVVGAYSLFVRTPVALWQRDKPFAVVFGLLFVLIVALGGGAISRMAAAEIATGERLRVRDAVDFALESWPRLILTPLLPLFIVAVLCLLLAVSGAVAMLPWLDVLGGVLYGVALLIGFIIAVLMIGYAAGFSLLIPAVAVENCDAADAQHRAYAYVLSRPFHLLGYGLVALVGLTLGYLFVSFFAMVVLNVTAAMVGLWSDNPAITAGGEAEFFDLAPDEPRVPLVHTHERWAASAVIVWHTLVVSLVVAYVMAYCFAASTIVYLLIRKKCDGQDIAEIWRPGMIPGTVTPAPDQDLNEPASV
jgi:hypothetical protein